MQLALEDPSFSSRRQWRHEGAASAIQGHCQGSVGAQQPWSSSPQPSQLLPDHFQVVPMLVTPNCQAGPAPRAHHCRHGWGRSFWRGVTAGQLLRGELAGM